MVLFFTYMFCVLFKTCASLRFPQLYNIYLMSYYGNVCFCSGDGFSLRGRTTSRRSILPGDRDDGECSFILYNWCSAYIYLIYHSHRNYYTASTQLHLHLYWRHHQSLVFQWSVVIIIKLMIRKLCVFKGAILIWFISSPSCALFFLIEKQTIWHNFWWVRKGNFKIWWLFHYVFEVFIT